MARFGMAWPLPIGSIGLTVWECGRRGRGARHGAVWCGVVVLYCTVLYCTGQPDRDRDRDRDRDPSGPRIDERVWNLVSRHATYCMVGVPVGKRIVLCVCVALCVCVLGARGGGVGTDAMYCMSTLRDLRLRVTLFVYGV